nr:MULTISPECIES: L-dopachrome tautomerase-related protein [unclassified Caballeronia]
MWIIDPGAPPAQSLIVPGAPKLVRIDFASNRVAQNFAFDESIAPQGSYVNDVRERPDGRFAYVTDSGVRGFAGRNGWHRRTGGRATLRSRGAALCIVGRRSRDPHPRPRSYCRTHLPKDRTETTSPMNS